MTDGERAALVCAARLLRSRLDFADYAEAVLVRSGGLPGRPALAILRAGDAARALQKIEEAVGCRPS